MFQRIGKEAYKANLHNTLELDRIFRHPHQEFESIHIAGTNGKGTTSHILASVFQTAGYTTGLYTSPHLKCFRERIKVNGTEIPEDFVVEFVDQYKPVFDTIQPSFFEMTVALAFHYFRYMKVDVAIIETGMGGRLDSTNIINPILSIITNISLDHTQFLGDTVKKIAEEKAGIIKSNVPTILGESSPDIDEIFIQRTKKVNSPILFADKVFSVSEFKTTELGIECLLTGKNQKELKLKSDLMGMYQFKNIRTAYAAFTQVREKYHLEINHFSDGLKNVKKNTGLQGRWQLLSHSPTILCDTGHNEAGIREVIIGLSMLKFEKLHFILGVVNDKDIDKILFLLPKNAKYYFTQASIPRAMDADKLKSNAVKFGLHGEIYNRVPAAVEAAKKAATKNDLIFIGGSTFIVAELF